MQTITLTTDIAAALGTATIFYLLVGLAWDAWRRPYDDDEPTCTPTENPEREPHTDTP